MIAFETTDLGTTGVIAAVVLGFIIFGFAKGVVRMTFALVALIAGSLAALWGFQKGGSIAGILVAKPDAWMAGAVAAILGLAVFFVTRALFGVLLSPVAVKDGKKQNAGPLGAVIGLVMGGIFAWLVLSGVRYVGTLSEMEWIKAAIADQTKITESEPPMMARAKRAIDSTQLGQWHARYDFLNDPATANLAKLNILRDNKVAYTAAAAADRPVNDALRQEDIQEMLVNQDEDVKTFIEQRQYSHLLLANQIKTVSQDPDARPILESLDIEKSLGLVKEKKEATSAKKD